MTTRRKFFGLMAATPLAGRVAAQGLAQQIGVNLANTAGQGQIALGGLSAANGATPFPTPFQIKDVLNNPLTRDVYESMVFEQERRVHSLDPDIAVHRSTSMAAKIAYQRQRNVAQHFEGVQGERLWTRMDSFIRKALGMEP